MGSRMNEMKLQANHHDGRPGRGQFDSILASVAACLFAVLPALAAGGPGTGGEILNPTVSGDETIGTLPVVGGGRIDLPFTRIWRGIEPAFYVEGTVADLTIAIQSARGRGFVSYEMLDSQTGRVRLAFHGNVLVAIDRELATNLPIDVGMAVPASFGEGRIAFTRAGIRSRIAELRPGVLPLGVASMLTTGVLDQAPVRIRTVNSAGIRTSHTLAATGDLLILGQTH